MSLIFPRLDRSTALELVEANRHKELSEIAERLPYKVETVTFPPIGGERVDDARLLGLRNAMLALAADHGMPGPTSRDMQKRFEGKASRLVHESLPMTAHEASEFDVWTNLTVGWLLDVAVWRFGSTTGDNRFLGDLNRNTFRRMWWRAEILGPKVDLEELGEDELTAIMERPTLFSDRRVARAIALEFLARVRGDSGVRRQELMRQATKRLLRLTPFVSFASLTDDDVRALVTDVFDAADAGVQGRPVPEPATRQSHTPAPSPEIRALTQVDMGLDDDARDASGSPPPEDLDEVKRAAIDIAKKTGRVTNTVLRELVHITPEQARQVFTILLNEGALVRRGVKRGTHYVLPDSGVSGSASGELPPPRGVTRESSPPRGAPRPPSAASVPPRGNRPAAPLGSPSRGDALRRLLRRGRDTDT